MASKLELEISEFVGAFGDLYSSEQKDFLFKHILEWEDSSGKETGMEWINKGAWPLPDVLKRLIDAANILLDKKDYDGPDYEEIGHARKRAKEIIEHLQSVPPYKEEVDKEGKEQ